MQRFGSYFVGVWFVLLGGCQPAGPLVPVTGTVTVENQPLVGARVQFIPQGSTGGAGGSGITNEEGKYEISPLNDSRSKGLPPGTYKVVFNKLIRPDGTQPPPHVKTSESGAEEKVPPPFCNPETTPLAAIKVEGSTKLYDFPLLSIKK